MDNRPKYDFVLIIAFGGIGLLSAWALAWNMILFDMPLDAFGFILGVIGVLSLGGTIIHIVDTFKRRKYYAWEVLKHGRNTFN